LGSAAALCPGDGGQLALQPGGPPADGPGGSLAMALGDPVIEWLTMVV